ncbi:MAG: GNAT family N-acetyltransferase [Blastocatellia bacterium]
MTSDITISTDQARLDLAVIHGFLSRSWWAEGVPVEIIRRAIEHSLCFGVYDGAQQIGFARVISDYATFAYLADVFILEAWRGRGLSKRLMREIMNHPDLQGLRRFALVTKDAHGLYQQFGFTDLAHPDRHLEIVRTEIYKEQK